MNESEWQYEHHYIFSCFSLSEIIKRGNYIEIQSLAGISGKPFNNLFTGDNIHH